MKKYYPTKSSLTLLKVILLLLTVGCCLLFRHYLKAYPIIMWTFVFIFCMLYIAFSSIWLPLFFSKTVYYVSILEVSKQSGVIFEAKQLMKVKSVQYITRINTPLSRFTGFNFIKLNALGGSITLLFLSKQDADEISATISAAIRRRDD